MEEHASVVNIHRGQEYDVYIGRPRSGEPWGYGNPFIVGVHGARGECVEMFEKWIKEGDPQGSVLATEERRKWIIEHLGALRGKRLGCFCYPNKCHGNLLAQWANNISTPDDDIIISEWEKELKERKE